jgi:hypothetical protein
MYHAWRVPCVSLHSSTTSFGIVSTYKNKQNFLVGGMLSGDSLQSLSMPQAMMPGACQARASIVQPPCHRQLSQWQQDQACSFQVWGAMIPSVPSPCVLMESSSMVLISSVTKHARPVRAGQLEHNAPPTAHV